MKLKIYNEYEEVSNGGVSFYRMDMQARFLSSSLREFFFVTIVFLVRDLC